MTHHPDKAKPDPAQNQTLETVNQHWVEITKAFKALTDEEVRNNYLQYGHPDGKQSYSIGIALPTFLVEAGYGKYTLIFYLGLLGIFLPYIVGKWWYGTQKVTKDGILVDSAGKLVREYDEEMTEGDVITVVSSGEEYESVISKSPSPKIEERILAEGQLSKYAGGLDDLDKAKLLDMDDPGRRKVLALLWAHLGRVDLGDETLNKGSYSVSYMMSLTHDRKICGCSNCLAPERRPQHHVSRLFQHQASSLDGPRIAEPCPGNPPWRTPAAAAAILHSGRGTVDRGERQGTPYRA